jgi:co-chaperonin GroES (HSP10)
VAIKEGDSVLYDKNAGFKLLIDGRQYLVILERDVVVVL